MNKQKPEKGNKPGNTGQPSDNHVFLVGRPPLAEYLGIVTSTALVGEEPDLRALADEWRSANDHIVEIEKQEAGWADNPPITPLSPSLEPLVDEVLKDPIFQRSFQIAPTQFGIVELDRLVVFQKHINLAYVHQVQKSIGKNPSEEAIFRTCLPFDHPQPPVQFRRIANNAVAFVSPSDDLRFLGSPVVRGDQITDYRPNGPISGVLALVVGFGSNFLNAIHAEDRLVLNNGSHRAFALREMGITHVPAIIQEVSRRDELQVIASGDLSGNPDRYLKEARPPLLKDYFDPRLRKVLPVPRKLRQVKVTFSVEQLDMPSTPDQ